MSLYLSVLSVFTLTSVSSTSDIARGPSQSHNDALLLFSIEIKHRDSHKWPRSVWTTESWGYQKQAVVWEIKDPISLRWSPFEANPELKGDTIKIIFHFRNIRDPDSFCYSTDYNLISLSGERERPCRNGGVPVTWFNYSRHSYKLCQKMRISRSEVFWMLNRGPLTLEIDIGFTGNADEEVTPMGPFIDPEMAERAHQRYSIRVPIIVDVE